jgi:hypothetical protein
MPYKQPGWQKPQSQEYMGRGVLHERLSSQVGNAGMAKSILVKRGDMNPDGTYTPKGMAKNRMTAEERSQTREFVKDSRFGRAKASPKSYIYDPYTNTSR